MANRAPKNVNFQEAGTSRDAFATEVPGSGASRNIRGPTEPIVVEDNGSSYMDVLDLDEYQRHIKGQTDADDEDVARLSTTDPSPEVIVSSTNPAGSAATNAPQSAPPRAPRLTVPQRTQGSPYYPVAYDNGRFSPQNLPRRPPSLSSGYTSNSYNSGSSGSASQGSFWRNPFRRQSFPAPPPRLNSMGQVGMQDSGSPPVLDPYGRPVMRPPYTSANQRVPGGMADPRGGGWLGYPPQSQESLPSFTSNVASSRRSVAARDNWIPWLTASDGYLDAAGNYVTSPIGDDSSLTRMRPPLRLDPPSYRSDDNLAPLRLPPLENSDPVMRDTEGGNLYVPRAAGTDAQHNDTAQEDWNGQVRRSSIYPEWMAPYPDEAYVDPERQELALPPSVREERNRLLYGGNPTEPNASGEWGANMPGSEKDRNNQLNGQGHLKIQRSTILFRMEGRKIRIATRTTQLAFGWGTTAALIYLAIVSTLSR